MKMCRCEQVVRLPGVLAILLLSTTLCRNSKAHPVEAFEKPQTHVGKGYVQDEQYQEAAREFQAALTADPHLVRARYQLAVCYFALGRRPEARQEFQRVRAETGDDPKVIYYPGRLDLLEADFDSSIRRLKSISAAPPFPDTDYYLGFAYLKTNDLEEAEKWLRRGGGTRSPRLSCS
jgi:tetratricopeptide (TPR) repeat protein